MAQVNGRPWSDGAEHNSLIVLFVVSEAPVPDQQRAANTAAESSADKAKRVITQFIKFGIVGGSGVLVNMAVMVIMHKLHGGDEYAGTAIWNIPWTDFWIRYRNIVYVVSFLVANVWNYELNRMWTFRGTKRTWWRGFWQFLCIGAVGALIGLLVQVATTHADSVFYLRGSWFDGDTGIHSREYWAQLIGVIIATPINFVVNKLITFRKGAGVQKSDSTPNVQDSVKDADQN
jgi:putative flippase GtrA